MEVYAGEGSVGNAGIRGEWTFLEFLACMASSYMAIGGQGNGGEPVVEEEEIVLFEGAENGEGAAREPVAVGDGQFVQDSQPLINQTNSIPLCSAVARGDLRAVMVCLNIPGIIVDWACSDGGTLLHMAARLGHQHVAEVLLEHKASVDIKNQRERTPLHMAALYPHWRIVRVLLMYGADVEAVDNGGKKALDLAEKRKHAAVILLLLSVTDEGIVKNVREKYLAILLEWIQKPHEVKVFIEYMVRYFNKEHEGVDLGRLQGIRNGLMR